MQIKTRIETSKPETPFEESLEQELLSYAKDLAQLLNKGLKFSDNFNAETLENSDTGNADTEFSIAHTLKRVPVGFVVTYIDKGGVIYDGGTAWTSTAIYFKCSAANANVKILVF